MKDYINKIRRLIGHEKIIHPAARIIIENEKQEILFVTRRDNGKIGLPAGALEEKETIASCIKREVKAETGLSIIELEVIGISSNPELEKVEYPNGDQIQYFTVEFYANKWEGELKVEDTNEIKTAQFMDRKNINRLPKNERSTIESLHFYRKEGKLLLK